MTYEFKTQGVCAQKIVFDLEDGIVKNVKFLGGIKAFRGQKRNRAD